MNDLNEPGKKKQTFDYTKYASYKRDVYCGMNQEDAELFHGSSFDAELWRAASQAADSERAKYSTPATKREPELDR